MFHRLRPRELPLEIRREVETLISDLGGKPSAAFRQAQEANIEMRARRRSGEATATKPFQ